ncbi:hypothetical protein ACHJH3_10880 [Campylobacter sp. MOP7]|uniref:hypothetical protein n=1 Tax=Campylobacter canis TaxID=3378588 RepID=UPI00387E3C3F
MQKKVFKASKPEITFFGNPVKAIVGFQGKGKNICLKTLSFREIMELEWDTYMIHSNKNRVTGVSLIKKTPLIDSFEGKKVQLLPVAELKCEVPDFVHGIADHEEDTPLNILDNEILESLDFKLKSIEKHYKEGKYL